jgi:hypothetical protein
MQFMEGTDGAGLWGGRGGGGDPWGSSTSDAWQRRANQEVSHAHVHMRINTHTGGGAGVTNARPVTRGAAGGWVGAVEVVSRARATCARVPLRCCCC